jgi:hypothetical protein
VVDFEQAAHDELPQHGAPDLVGLAGAEALAGAVDGGEQFLRRKRADTIPLAENF